MKSKLTATTPEPRCLSRPAKLWNRFLAAFAVLFCLGIFDTKADIYSICGIDLGAAGRTKTWAVFSLSGDFTAEGSSHVKGDVGVAGNGRVTLSGMAAINGDLYYRRPGLLRVNGQRRIKGAIFHDAASDALLDQGVIDSMNASDQAWALPVSPQYKNFSLNPTGSNTLSGAPGECVVLKLTNFNLRGGGTLTLQGSTSTAFVINVTGQFSLSSNARVILAGGVTWDNVLFNVRGSGTDVSIDGRASLTGFLVANGRAVSMAGNATVYGQINAKNVSLSGNARVTRPLPTASE